VPRLHRQLARDQGRARADAVVEQFEQVVAFARTHRRNCKVVNDHEVQLGQLRQTPHEAAVAVRDLQLVEQPGRAHVQHREAAARGLVCQSTGQPRLAAAGGAGDQQIARMAQPIAAGQRGDKRAVQGPTCTPVDVLDAGRGNLELGGLEQPGHAPPVAPGDFALHQQRQPVVEGEWVTT